MTSLEAKSPSSSDSPYPDCTPFMNWTEDQLETVGEQAVVFRSLVATVKSQHAFDDLVEAKMVNFIDFVTLKSSQSADVFLDSLASPSDDSLINFIQYIVVLISSARERIITTTMKMLEKLIIFCSVQIPLALIKADLVPQLIKTLNPQSLSFAEAAEIHVYLLKIIWNTLWVSTLNGLTRLGIKDGSEQQAVRKTILKQVLFPSEKYICHLCMNRYSIVDGEQSRDFLTLLAQLLRISPSYQPTMEFVLDMPVVLTIPSCLIVPGQTRYLR
ncbi:hypothetical protein BLNAU_14933 [Blattamonas nauphoetae]|uniref:Uncharacterized protein n=1 Tax=Blattamonas nauphoetae TaxID=2049346 RepID=A0ABQ9XDV3_9EUKA|nr:hypothetical protein BLNAU_14933 [Blattamonas nauphoetae]